MNLLAIFAVVMLSTVAQAVNEGGCTLQSVTYDAATWEKGWRDDILRLQSDNPKWDIGCAAMKDAEPQIESWLNYCQARKIIAVAQDNFGDSTPMANLGEPDHNVMSSHTYTYLCDGETVVKEVPIEPLAGFLRHPLLHCFTSAHQYMVSTDHIVMPFRNEIILPFGARTYLFDLGSDLYDGGDAHSNQKWIIDSYKARGLHFDRIVSWEKQNYPPEIIFRSMPMDVFLNSTFFNLPVSTAATSNMNFLAGLRLLAVPKDWVVVKLDLENEITEIEMIYQIFEDEQLRGLIDEIHWDHHVLKTPMTSIWGLEGMDINDHNTLGASYVILSKLREFGIRAHSWV